jgi:hypothetical protein
MNDNTEDGNLTKKEGFMSISKEVVMKVIDLQYSQARAAIKYMATSSTHPGDLTVALGIVDITTDLIRTALESADEQI